VSPCIPHIFNLIFIQMAHFVLFSVGTKTKFVNAVKHLTKVIPALYAVFEFAENLANLVFNSISTFGTGFKLLEVREELVVYKFGQIIACLSLVMVEFYYLFFMHCPSVPLYIWYILQRIG